MDPITRDTPRLMLLLNGKSAGNAQVRQAVHALRERGVVLDVRVTWEQGDVQRYVDEALAAGVDTLIAGGGDGTVGELASAMAAQARAGVAMPTLGVLALGTANDFATAAGIPAEPLAALELVAARPATAVDVLLVEGDGRPRWCINMATGGFGTQVTVETDPALKRALGGLAYTLTGLSMLGRGGEPLQARLSGPDFAWEGRLVALGIGNGRLAGGGQALCPQARIDDGALDLTILPDPAGELAGALGKLVSGGRQAALEHVAVQARLPWLEIGSDAPLTLNLDGEPQAARHFRIACIAGLLRMHLPVDCPLLADAPA